MVANGSQFAIGYNYAAFTGHPQGILLEEIENLQDGDPVSGSKLAPCAPDSSAKEHIVDVDWVSG